MKKLMLLLLLVPTTVWADSSPASEIEEPSNFKPPTVQKFSFDDDTIEADRASGLDEYVQVNRAAKVERFRLARENFFPELFKSVEGI